MLAGRLGREIGGIHDLGNVRGCDERVWESLPLR
jgi:hypothetical protein